MTTLSAFTNQTMSRELGERPTRVLHPFAALRSTAHGVATRLQTRRQMHRTSNMTNRRYLEPASSVRRESEFRAPFSGI